VCALSFTGQVRFHRGTTCPARDEAPVKGHGEDSNKKIPRESRLSPLGAFERAMPENGSRASWSGIARTSICALFRGARDASAFKMNPGEGFLIPKGFIPLPVFCFCAGGCVTGEGR